MKPIKPDGLNTPGLVWHRRSKRHRGKAIKQPDDPYAGYWVARDDIIDRGYTPKTQRQWPLFGKPYSPPTEQEWEVIAARCTKLQDEMLAWSNGIPVGAVKDAKKFFDGTMGALVDLYLTDPDSPFFANRFHTRKTYRSRLSSIKRMIGEARVVPLTPDGEKITFHTFKRWGDKWSEPKIPGGPRRPARAHGFMSFVRILISFGMMTELPRCDVLHSILSEMKFKTPKKRTQIVNREQAIAIIAEAHRRGDHSIAFAQALMSDFMVRQKDAIGEWIPQSEPGISDILNKDMKWLCGFRWDEIENGVLDHRMSKSLRGKDAISDPDAGRELPYTLALYPLVMAEIARIPEENRHGALVKAEHNGLPWIQKVFAPRWRKIARAVDIPDKVQNRDSRAGGATEAENMGASREKIRPALGHRKVETTDIYLRNERAGPDNIARLRFGGDEKP